MTWVGWPLGRVLLLFLGIVFLAIFAQVTLMHGRQNFRHWAMWVPVIGTPTAGILALLAVWSDAPILTTLLFYVCTLVGIGGLIGTYFHVDGVGHRVDGYTLSNFLVGPPVVMPVMVTAMSALGLIILYFL